MRIVFCDDEPTILMQIQNYVKEYFQSIGGLQPEYAAYSDGDSLLASENLKADLAFLDVEMPGVNGIHVGVRLKEANPNIRIFIVTAFPDYLDDAMRFQVFRYLSKPIDKNRLFRNLKDAVARKICQYGKIHLSSARINEIEIQPRNHRFGNVCENKADDPCHYLTLSRYMR